VKYFSREGWTGFLERRPSGKSLYGKDREVAAASNFLFFPSASSLPLTVHDVLAGVAARQNVGCKSESRAVPTISLAKTNPCAIATAICRKQPALDMAMKAAVIDAEGARSPITVLEISMQRPVLRTSFEPADEESTAVA
jgi:hypothetical protein